MLYVITCRFWLLRSRLWPRITTTTSIIPGLSTLSCWSPPCARSSRARVWKSPFMILPPTRDRKTGWVAASHLWWFLNIKHACCHLEIKRDQSNVYFCRWIKAEILYVHWSIVMLFSKVSHCSLNVKRLNRLLMKRLLNTRGSSLLCAEKCVWCQRDHIWGNYVFCGQRASSSKAISLFLFFPFSKNR